VAITQYILGIQPTLNGLRFSPVIPTDWPGFSARRVYRGVTYHINVMRAGKGNTVALKVDGKAVEGDVVPLPAAGTTEVTVEVVMN
jgi:cellobiose phosphorylase